MSTPYQSIFKLLPLAIRRRFYSAVFLMGAVGVLEVFSLSALLAFFNVGVNDSTIGRWVTLRIWMESLGAFSPSGILLAFALSVLIFKSFILFFVGRHSYTTAIEAKKYFQNSLFNHFLKSPFHEHSGKSSADWIRSITADCNAIEGRFLMPVLVLLGEIIPSFCVCCVLLIVNPIAFFVAILIFALVGIFVYLSTHQRLVFLGQAQQTADGQIVKSVQQAFNGLRELTIYRLQTWAQYRFESYTEASSNAVNEALSISLIPRFVFEVAVYVSIGFIFIIYALQGTPILQVIGEFTVFAAAAMRLLPSVSKVVSHLQSLKHAKPSVVAITEAMYAAVYLNLNKSLDDAETVSFGFLSLEDVGFSYGDHQLLRCINLKIAPGDLIAVEGSSGSGKSTLINLILGLLSPTRGKVMLNGEILKGQEEQWWASVGYVPQEPFLLDSSAIANVMLGSAFNSEADLVRARELIYLMELPEILLDTEKSIGEAGAKLSGGQRQRLAIARALYRKPKVLILDEATSAMDIKTQAHVMEVLTSFMKGGTVVMITHRTETLGYFNKLLTLSEGQLKVTTSSYD